MRILIVEDDEDIARLEQDYLEMDGFETRLCDDGGAVLTALEQEPMDLVLLDVMLPGKDGFQLCREIRKTHEIPVLMVTARTESIDKIRGLGLGADDYIVKPFDPAELVARVKAHLKRYVRLTGRDPLEDEVIHIGALAIHSKSWKVYQGEKEIKFPNREFELLRFLAQNPNIVFTKERLFEAVWGFDYYGDAATVMVHINRIREKIEDDPKNPSIIETIWGAGYRLNV